MGSSYPDVPVALFLGGMDPSGGAGVLRDALVASDLGVYPMVVPMAQTLQNGFHCQEITMPSVNPQKALDCLKPHLGKKWGVKLSMFRDGSLLRDALSCIHQLKPLAAIWDPVIAPSSGVGLHSVASIMEALTMLSGNSWVVSPNIPEARSLAGLPDAPLEDVAKKILDLGIQSVWLRGGHCTGDTVQDLWCDSLGNKWLTRYNRLDGEPRGTGCTVTSAWLALRLRGMEPIHAAESAVQYIRKAWSGLILPGAFGRPTFPPRVQ
jgi:hydroxymethylpyrimidine/phosphomethylpyrimidine kinase